MVFELSPLWPFRHGVVVAGPGDVTCDTIVTPAVVAEHAHVC
jgi:hypothetical protein